MFGKKNTLGLNPAKTRYSVNNLYQALMPQPKNSLQELMPDIFSIPEYANILYALMAPGVNQVQQSVPGRRELSFEKPIASLGRQSIGIGTSVPSRYNSLLNPRYAV